MGRTTAGVKRVWVNLPRDAWEIIDKLKSSETGNDESVILKEIVLSYMRDKRLLRDRKLLDELVN